MFIGLVDKAQKQHMNKSTKKSSCKVGGEEA
jgi:hypothetical protein